MTGERMIKLYKLACHGAAPEFLDEEEKEFYEGLDFCEN